MCQENVELTEAHIVMTCKYLDKIRKECKINLWCEKNKMTHRNESDKLKSFLGDDGASGPVLLERGKSLIRMRNELFSIVQKQKELQQQVLNDLDLWERANIEQSQDPSPEFGKDHSVWDSWNTILQK